MVALASHVRADGPPGYCWPGNERLARCISRTQRQVIRLIHALEIAGWLTCNPRSAGEGKRTTSYVLNMARLASTSRSDAQMSPRDPQPDSFTATYSERSDAQMSPGVRSDIKGGCEVTFEPLRSDISPLPIRMKERTIEQAAADASERVIVYDEFAQVPPPKRPELVKPVRVGSISDVDTERIYKAFPRHDDAKPAKAAIKAKHALIVKGLGRDNNDEPLPRMSSAEAVEYFYTAVMAYAAYERARGTEQNMMPLCATWFNKSRFSIPYGAMGTSPQRGYGGVATNSPVPRSVAEKIAEQRSGTR